MDEAPASPPTRRRDAGHVLLIVFGVLVALLAAALVVAGGLALWVDQTRRDDSGYLHTSTEQFLTRTYAITTDPFEIELGEAGDWLVGDDVFGDVRLRAESADPDVGVFIGIGPTSDVERYLGGVELDRVIDLDSRPFRATYERQSGGAPPTPPDEQTFWAASASGRNEQTLIWEAESGDWTIVAMNDDGSRAVDVRVQAGAQLGLLDWLGAIVLAVGVLLLAAGVAMTTIGIRRP